jgi:hypothetical protein
MRGGLLAKAARGELTFPARGHTGPRSGQLYWKPPRLDQVLDILHNPRYAPRSKSPQPGRLRPPLASEHGSAVQQGSARMSDPHATITTTAKTSRNRIAGRQHSLTVSEGSIVKPARS